MDVQTRRPRPAAITLTPAAEARVADLMVKAPTGAIGVKLSTPRRGCSGLAYSVDYVTEANSFDERIETPGGSLFVDGGSILYLVGSVMDWVEDDFAAGFTFENPNAKGPAAAAKALRFKPAALGGGAMDPRFAHVTDWIFDLDNTLYPASTRLFDLIDERMSAYVQRLLGCDPVEARRVQKEYFRDHGTTLAGLMKHHAVDPHHFCDDVHAIALDRVAPNERLLEGLRRLPGRRFVFTNGNAAYAERVLAAIGIGDMFHGLVDIHACDHRPKPDAHGYRLLVDRFGIDPGRAVLVEDMAKNLVPAKAMGMTTVWVDNGSDHGDHLHDPHAIDLTITDVADWLTDLLEDAHVG